MIVKFNATVIGDTSREFTDKTTGVVTKKREISVFQVGKSRPDVFIVKCSDKAPKFKIGDTLEFEADMRYWEFEGKSGITFKLNEDKR